MRFLIEVGLANTLSGTIPGAEISVGKLLWSLRVVKGSSQVIIWRSLQDYVFVSLCQLLRNKIGTFKSEIYCPSEIMCHYISNNLQNGDPE